MIELTWGHASLGHQGAFPRCTSLSPSDSRTGYPGHHQPSSAELQNSDLSLQPGKAFCSKVPSIHHTKFDWYICCFLCFASVDPLLNGNQAALNCGPEVGKRLKAHGF